MSAAWFKPPPAKPLSAPRRNTEHTHPTDSRSHLSLKQLPPKREQNKAALWVPSVRVGALKRWSVPSSVCLLLFQMWRWHTWTPPEAARAVVSAGRARRAMCCYQNKSLDTQASKPGACRIREGAGGEGAAVIIEPFTRKHTVAAFGVRAPPADGAQQSSSSSTRATSINRRRSPPFCTASFLIKNTWRHRCQQVADYVVRLNNWLISNTCSRCLNRRTKC